MPWGVSPSPFQEQSPSPLLLHSLSKFSHSQFCSEIPGCQRTGLAKGVACSDFLFFGSTGIELRASCIRGQYFTTEL